MTEATSGTLPAEDLRICPECGRIPKRVIAGKCETCYKRARRAAGTPVWPLPDPDIMAGLLEVPGTSPTFARRVFAHVDASGDCWEWRGAKTHGYGVINRGGKGTGNEQAHRAVWLLLVGEIPDGFQLDHLCRNRACVNVDHLEPVTAAENKRRGFSSAVLYAKRETCEFGHPLDGVRGTRGSERTDRYCLTCNRERCRAAYVPKEPSTTCKKGHEWTPESTYINPKTGRRTCKICKADGQRARNAARKRADWTGELDKAA
jgi:hypothetical protein